MPYCLNKLRKQESFNLYVMMNILFISESTESLLGNLIFLDFLFEFYFFELQPEIQRSEIFRIKRKQKEETNCLEVIKRKKTCNVFED